MKFLTNQTDEEDLKEEKINKAFKILLKKSTGAFFSSIKCISIYHF